MLHKGIAPDDPAELRVINEVRPVDIGVDGCLCLQDVFDRYMRAQSFVLFQHSTTRFIVGLEFVSRFLGTRPYHLDKQAYQDSGNNEYPADEREYQSFRCL
jgi:hypothetical protein